MHPFDQKMSRAKIAQKLQRCSKSCLSNFCIFCKKLQIDPTLDLTTYLTYGKNLLLTLCGPYWPHDDVIIIPCANQRAILSLKRGDIVWQQGHGLKHPYPSGSMFLWATEGRDTGWLGIFIGVLFPTFWVLSEFLTIRGSTFLPHGFVGLAFLVCRSR